MGRDAEKAVVAGRRGGRGAKERGRGRGRGRGCAAKQLYGLRGSLPSGEIRKISQIIRLTAERQRHPRPARRRRQWQQRPGFRFYQPV